MPHSFFILSRLFLRVDNVLFRIHDVRIYHAFGSGEIVREVSGMEAEYADVKAVCRFSTSSPSLILPCSTGLTSSQRLEKPSDLSPLANPNFVHSVMSSLSSDTGRPPLPHRGSSARGKAWPGLGKRIEVLRIEGLNVDGATGELQRLGI